MIKKSLLIQNKLGLHARATAKFVSLATKYASHIDVQHGEQLVNGKSIMGVMMLAASKGTTIEVIAEGEDEAQAIAALEELINHKFGEKE